MAERYVIKTRDRRRALPGASKGPWGPWQGQRYCPTAQETLDELGRFQTVEGSRDVGVFRNGRRLTLDQLQEACTEESNLMQVHDETLVDHLDPLSSG